MLKELADCSENEVLDLKCLSYKLTMLRCLISFRRVSDVRTLEISSCSYLPEGVCFTIGDEQKLCPRLYFMQTWGRTRSCVWLSVCKSMKEGLLG